MDTNCSLRQRLILALTTDTVELDSASAEWAYCALVPNPNPSLGFQNSFLTFLADKPSRLRIPGTKTLPSAWPPEEKRCPMGLTRNPK